MTLPRECPARRTPATPLLPWCLLLLGLSAAPAWAQATSTQAGKLFPAAGTDFQSFGRDCLSDGDVALITGPGTDNSGAAYCYRRVGGVWSQVQKLLAFDGAASDRFGSAVALGGDLIVIGAAQDSDAGTSSGSAYVYRRAGPTWVFEQKLTASTADAADQFGWNVATDGERIVVSAVEDEQPGQGATGAVFVFEHDGASWQQVQRFVPADLSAGDWFGWDLSLDGNALAVGATNHDQPFADCGAVYVYRDDGSAWSLEDKLIPSQLGAGHSFGFSVAIQGDRLVAGAPGTGATLSGALYQFHFNGSDWVEVHQWVTSDTAVAAFPPPQLGMSCGIDGQTVFGGAPFHDGAVVNSGAAYRFVLTDLGLDAVPDAVPFAGSLSLKTFGGLAGAPMALVVVSVSSVPVGAVLWLGTFDAQGQTNLTVNVPPGASGLQATFLSAGFWQPGYKALSNSVSVTFQ